MMIQNLHSPVAFFSATRKLWVSSQAGSRKEIENDKVFSLFYKVFHSFTVKIEHFVACWCFFCDSKEFFFSISISIYNYFSLLRVTFFSLICYRVQFSIQQQRWHIINVKTTCWIMEDELFNMERIFSLSHLQFCATTWF